MHPIRKYMIETGRSAENIAHWAGISTTTIYSIEKGNNFSITTLHALAGVMEIKPMELKKLLEEHKNP